MSALCDYFFCFQMIATCECGSTLFLSAKVLKTGLAQRQRQSLVYIFLHHFRRIKLI